MEKHLQKSSMFHAYSLFLENLINITMLLQLPNQFNFSAIACNLRDVQTYYTQYIISLTLELQQIARVKVVNFVLELLSLLRLLHLCVLVLQFIFPSQSFYNKLFINELTGLQANGLKKNIFGRPSPYVKLSIMPSRRHLRSWKQHHGQIAKTSSQTNTTNPKWNSEVSIVK